MVNGPSIDPEIKFIEVAGSQICAENSRDQVVRVKLNFCVLVIRNCIDGDPMHVRYVECIKSRSRSDVYSAKLRA